jgi:hypothetical protein
MGEKGKKHKLILIDSKENKERIKRKIVDFVYDRWMNGEDTILQDIRDVFEEQPYDLSNKTVRNYLNELVENRKLSTVKTKNNRLYMPPKLPVSLKIGVGISTLILLFYMLSDMFLTKVQIKKYIYLDMIEIPKNAAFEKISTLPIAAYMLLITVFFTIVAYIFERKTRK